MPILLAIGWSEQRIKIEWKRTDLALFRDVYQRGAEPDLILESKRMREGLGYAERQVARYAREFPGCQRLIASDGIRYQLYRRGDPNGKWKFTAYMNLLKLRDRHPYLEDISGASDLGTELMPQ
ncbi:MAG: hypothetical protein O3A47_01230 [Chloroflexi bacterium]|nr:hypothetical protein [Chloroflexota bacterium]